MILRARGGRAVNADDWVADFHASADDAPKRDPTEVIAVVEIRDEHLEILLGRSFGGGMCLTMASKSGSMSALFVQFALGVAVLRAGVDDWKIQLLVGGVELDKEVEDQVEHLVRAGIFAVDLVDDDDRLRAVFERLAQHESAFAPAARHARPRRAARRRSSS